MNQRRERPIRRVLPSGRVVWQARPHDAAGLRRSLGNFERKGPCRERDRVDCCAQHAIDRFYEQEAMAPRSGAMTVGDYAVIWLERHPRSARTNRSSQGRVNAALGIKIDGRELRDWHFADLRRRQAKDVLAALLRDQGRAAKGATGVMAALSAMAGDAAEDEVIGANPFSGITVRVNDPRVTKAPREPVVYSWAEMHGFAAAAALVKTKVKATYTVKHSLNEWRPIYAEPMIRMLTDCGLRLGEMLALKRANQDLKAGVFMVEGSAWEGKVVPTNPHKNHDRTGPIPDDCLALLRGLPPRIDTPLLFPTPSGKLWRERNFRRDVWDHTQKATGLALLPHDCRHSWVSLLTAAGVDDSDLAQIAGHSVSVQRGVYRHALGRSHDDIRRAVG